jgi:hypothetical protein
LQLPIFALGIMPYITASIILQLLTVVILGWSAEEGGQPAGIDTSVHPLPDDRAGNPVQSTSTRRPRAKRPAIPLL